MTIRESDYENYDYQEFWADNKRLYEDSSERMALRKILSLMKKSSNGLFIDLGCGYGRLFSEYKNFSRIILVDYSYRNLINARAKIEKFYEQNQKKLNHIYFIEADVASLPFKDNIADVVLAVRVIHHLQYPEKFFNEVRRILKHGSVFLLEFANKRNLKNILKFLAGKMNTSPFNLKPSEVGETILNFHPKYIFRNLQSRGFKIVKKISVSNFRLGFIKRMIGIKFLVFLEKIYQKILPRIILGPSIFTWNILENKRDSNISDYFLDMEGKEFLKLVLKCPECSAEGLILKKEAITCSRCHTEFPIKEGIIVFKK